MKDDFVDNIKIEDEPKNFYFQKAGKIYKITIFLLTDNISLIISETNKFSQIYGIKLNLKQIKAKHISFSKLLSLQEFIKIVKDNNEQKAINITKISEYIIRFELTKYSVYFGLTKKEISNDKILENINIIKEKYEQKLSESNKTKKLIQEIDEIKKTNKILIEENEKLKEIIFLEEKNKKEANNKDKEILELKQELEEIKNFIEKFKNNEVEPIWAKTISFKEKFEKKNKLDITCKEINNIISKNNNYYKINIFEQKQNYIDKQEAINIGKQINKYEQENQIIVSKISIYKDKNARTTYNEIDNSTELNYSAIALKWSSAQVIDYYNERLLIEVDNDKEIEDYFNNFDWDSFCNEQLIFIDDTLHLCIY